MSEQLYYEDVEAGNEVTPLAKIATTRILVQWAGATGDFNPLHYESEYARTHGAGEPIIHGTLKRAWLTQLMTDWLGEQGELRKFYCRYRGMDYPRKMKNMDESQEGDTWWCKGKVTRKYVEDSEHFVECEIWVENAQGEKTTTGTALATLPSRSKD